MTRVLCGLLVVAACAAAPPVVDFTEGREAQGWNASHDLAALKPSPEGLLLRATGGDPFLHGPRGDYRGVLSFVATLRSERAGWAQVFASHDGDREASSAHVWVRAGWNDVSVPLPPMGEGWRLRFDPPGDGVLARIGVEEVGACGVTSVRVTGENVVLALRGVDGPVEIVELAPHQTLDEVAGAVWKGRAQPEIVLPQSRRTSGFVAMVPHAVRGRVPVGTVRFAEEFPASGDARPFPDPGSKKGLQVQMIDDALALGVRHAGVNLNLGALLDPEAHPGNPTWTLDGETFAFRRSYLESLGVKRLSEAGVAVYLIVLAYAGSPLDARLLHPARDAKLPNHIAAVNTVTPEGARLWQATMEFLADWFSRADDEHGRVAGYIIGNEVNVHWQWHNLGRMPRNVMIADYLRQVRIAHAAVRRSSAAARVYLSLTHFWTIDPDRDAWISMPGRYLLEEFARQARAGGDFDWHLAHHPYPENLGNPRTWEDKTAPPVLDAQRITFRNLEQLDAFFDRPELLYRGQRRRVILSEQGFHSNGTAEGDRDQAAGYCYAWEKIARLPGIDAFILHRHVDHRDEGGLNLGLWRRRAGSVADPDTPRPMYEVFKAAGTPAQEAAFRFALPVVGLKSWDEVMK
jgi:hypothetical protein